VFFFFWCYNNIFIVQYVVPRVEKTEHAFKQMLQRWHNLQYRTNLVQFRSR